MDVFDAALAAGAEFFVHAAVAAAHDLGVFAALAAGPAALDEVARTIGVRTGQHRLRALLDVLAATGSLTRDDQHFAAAVTPPRPVVVGAGWGRLAEIIRRDRPLALAPEASPAYHAHLLAAGAEAARELAPRLGDGPLLDLGAGAGAYTAAFLAARPAARVTLVDDAAVLALAEAALAAHRDRVRLVAGDARQVALGAEHDVALYANVLHLHPPAVCAALCAAAAAAVRPGGRVVIKDLRRDDDGRGPLPGLVFALNMAVYTAGGDVHATAALRGWLAGAGLIALEEHRLAAAPEAVVLVGHKPR